MKRPVEAGILRKTAYATMAAALAVILCGLAVVLPPRAIASTGAITNVGWQDSITEYGWTQSTTYMELDGRLAICAQHFSSTPSLGALATEIDGNVGNDAMRKVSWYGWGGPGDLGMLSLVQTACAMSNANGVDITLTGRDALNSVAGLPSPPDTFVLQKWSTGGVTQDLVTWSYNPNGALELDKDSSNPTITDGNTCYDLSGAVYGVYASWDDANGRRNAVASLVTDSDGHARIDTVAQGTYYVREAAQAKGYALDDAIYPVTVSGGGTAYVNGGKVYDKPQNDPAAMWVGKIDLETTLSMPQGSASLKGAEYTVRYYPRIYSTAEEAESSGAAARTWVVATNENGYATLTDEYKVSGDDYFYGSDGFPTMPLGSILIQETKAPDGYILADSDVFLRNVTSTGTVEAVETYDVPVQKEQVVKGDIALMKYGETQANPDDDPTLKAPLSGVSFEIVNKGKNAVISPEGNLVEPEGVVCAIMTDSQGWASTESLRAEGAMGSLSAAEYEVREVAETTPAGYQTVEPFTVSVTEGGQVLHYVLEDKTGTAIKVVKKDAGTQKTVAGYTKFRILDSDMDPVTFTSYYPQTMSQTVFTTNATGACVLPEKLMAGQYYLQEVEAPSGYLLDDTPIPFAVDSSTVGTFASPLVVTMEDEPAMGMLDVTKVDAETGQAIATAGTSFEVSAAEDIVTMDGTCRCTQGTVVASLVTDATGHAQSVALYPGKYTVRETSAPKGYVLSEESATVTVSYKDGLTPVTLNTSSYGDAAAMGVIEVSKTDAATGLPVRVAGVEFDVTAKADVVTPDGTLRVHAGETVAHLSTDDEGVATTPTLYLGAYEITETKAPEGYMLASKPRVVTLEYADQLTPVVSSSVTVSDEVQKGIIVVTKTDADTGSAVKVAGTQFDIIAKNDITTPDGSVKSHVGEIVATVTTNDEGVATTSALYLGDYLVKEKKAPDGWVLPEGEVPVTLLYDTRGVEITMASVTFSDKQTSFDIVKKDVESENSLEGARFAFWEQDSEGIADNVGNGSVELEVDDEKGYASQYQLVAREDIMGYASSDETELTVLIEKGAVGADFETDDGATYSASAPCGDYYITARMAGGTSVAVAALSLSGSSPLLRYNVAAVDTSTVSASLLPSLKGSSETATEAVYVETGPDGTATVKNLKPGTYVIQETKAPTGYAVDSSLHYLTIDENGRIDGKESGSIVVRDRKTEVSVQKLDLDTHVQIAGALLAVKDANGGWIDVASHIDVKENLVTMCEVGSEDGKEPSTVSIPAWETSDTDTALKGLPEGDYTLIELSAPADYAKAEDVSFHVDAAGGLQTVTMYDEYNGEILDQTGADAPNDGLGEGIVILITTTLAALGILNYRRHF